MSHAVHRRRALTRAGVILSTATLAVATIGAASYTPAPGYTYRIRMTTSNVNFGGPGGPGGGGAAMGGDLPVGRAGGNNPVGGSVTLAEVKVSGNKARIEIIASTEGGGPGGGGGGRGGGRGGGGDNSLQDQVFLVIDSTHAVTLNTAQHNYMESDAIRGLNGVGGMGRGGRGGGPQFNFGDSTANRGRGAGGDSAARNAAAGRRGNAGGGGGGGAGGAGGGGRGNPGGGGGGGGGNPNDLVLNSVAVTSEKMPGDTTIDGFKATHYRIIFQFTVTPIMDPVTIKRTMDLWMADLPFKLVNPWDQTLNQDPAPDNLRELQLKYLSVRRTLPGTPILIVSSLPMGGMLGGIFGGRGAVIPPNAMAALGDSLTGPGTTQKVAVYGFKAVDISDDEFKVPSDYTRAQGRGRGGEEER